VRDGLRMALEVIRIRRRVDAIKGGLKNSNLLYSM
jgi:hypothetical protein